MSEVIRVRAGVAAVRGGQVLLVPHYDTDAGPVQWNVPSGRVEFCERLEDAALREFSEETGLTARIERLLDVTEVVLPERPWHSVLVTFLGSVVRGALRSESGHTYGEKVARWFPAEEIADIACHPRRTGEEALGIRHGGKERTRP